MVDPASQTPFQSAFGPADHGLMIPVSHVVLARGAAAARTDSDAGAGGRAVGLEPAVPSHGTIVTEVLVSLLLIVAFS